MNALQLAQRYRSADVHELDGNADHPLIRWWLSLCGFGLIAHDEIPWCSAFVNGIAWELELPRSKSAAARSWLRVGEQVALADAVPGYDVVVFQRGTGPQPGPEVLAAPGHVAFFVAREGDRVRVLGGNQSDAITVSTFPAASVLAVRRLLSVDSAAPGGASPCDVSSPSP